MRYKVSFDTYSKFPNEKSNDIYFSDTFLQRCEKQWKNFKVCPSDPQPNLFEVMVDHDADIPLAFSESLKIKIGLHEKQLENAQAIISKIRDLTCSFATSSQSPFCKM